MFNKNNKTQIHKIFFYFMNNLIFLMKPKLLQGYSDSRHRHKVTNTI